jgi:hypothetical protein
MPKPARVLTIALAFMIGAAGPALGQTPVPFPRPGDPQKPTAPPPETKAPPAKPGAVSAKPGAVPTEATLGMPIYPTAEFITSYDAGRGQRYYLFGTNATFAEIVAYYRSILKQRGEQVYDEPPVHMFDVGRFREETMAFPPGITVKDYTWGGMTGYLNPYGTQGQRYPTVIQIVPAPAGSGR